MRVGEILGLAGQLGSGSSALLAAIGGANRRRGGKVSLDEIEVTPNDPLGAKRAGIAYCSSDRKRDGLFLGLSVTANLNSPAPERVSRFGGSSLCASDGGRAKSPRR